MKKVVLIYIIFDFLYGQQLPFGVPYYSKVQKPNSIFQIKMEVPFNFSEEIFQVVNPIEYKNKHIFFLELSFKKIQAMEFILSSIFFEKTMKLFFIDKNTYGWVGPYTSNNFQNSSILTTGRLKTNNIIIEISIEKDGVLKNPIKSIINSIEINTEKIILNTKSKTFRQGNKKILLTGYWPPSNEGIRSFSQNPMLNSEGWMGHNWEERGFDIISFFPSFLNPDCESCGQGFGDLEVDYQDTSEDWWNIVDSINPMAIITFSRGYIDYSWELEWQYYNHYNWVADFTQPYIPTPCPPDSTFLPNTSRYSNLPMRNIVYAIEEANLGLYPYIDYSNGAGGYLSEYIGYHGVWQKAKMDSLNIACVVAGHVHVGGLVDWETTRKAVEITIREVIKVLNDYQNSAGDINQDGVISNLDILLIVNHLIWNLELTDEELYRADINFDEVINLLDLILLSDIIISFQ